MIVGYYTDNNVSHSVMKTFSRIGIKVKHIRDFDPSHQAIFYGILRGSGTSIRLMQHLKKDFWYVDNGYFDAQYMDANKHKEMTGKFRIVKNATIETYDAQPIVTHKKKMRVMLLPPSPYTAFMHDTTPEDWVFEWRRRCDRNGHIAFIRDKSDEQPLDRALKQYDAVLAFNSMGVMTAIREGKAVYTTHGIIRNTNLFEECAPYYNMEAIEKFYSDKQFTLQEIQEKGISCLH